METCESLRSLNFDADYQRVKLCDTVKSQMSSVLAMALACKMRLAITPAESSRLLLQSLLPSGSVSAGTTEGFRDTFNMGVGVSGDSDSNSNSKSNSSWLHPDAQQSRVTVTLGDAMEAKDTHTDHLLQMFSSSVDFSKVKQPNQNNLASVSETEGEHSSLSSIGGLRRQESSPVLPSMVKPKANEQASIIGLPAFLKRRASSSALYTVRESKANNSESDDLLPQSSVSSSCTVTSFSSTRVVQEVNLETSASEATYTSSKQSNIDSLDASSTNSKGFGILSRTRKFGAWLGKVTHGERVEVSRKDLNVFAPTSF